MPPPASFVDITSDSFSYQVQVAEFNVANERWFRMVTGPDPVVFGWFVGLSTGFNPDVDLFESDGSTPITSTDGAISMARPLANNSTYYARVTNNIGPNGPISFAFNTLWEWIIIGGFTVPDGSFLINDDLPVEGTTGYPAAVYGPDGTFLGYVGGIPAGEIGDTLPNRVSLWHDRYGMFGGQLALLDADFGFVDDFTPAPPLLVGEQFFPNIVNDGTVFYVVDRANTGNVYIVDPVAVTISAAIATIAYDDIISAVGVRRDGAIMYWAEGGFSNQIRAWNLATNTLIGTIYSVPGLGANFEIGYTGVNGHPGEILVLPDDTIVFYVHDYTNDTDRVIHISPAGVLLNDIAFDTNGAPGIIDHIHYPPSGSSSIHIWFFTDSGAATGRYGSLDLTTGVFTQLMLVTLRNDGASLVAGSDTIFSPSASCAMVTVGYPLPVPPPPTTSVCPPAAWLQPAPSGCVAVGELPDNDG